MSSFQIFYYTGRSMNDCCQAMDEPPRFQPGTPLRSDSQEADLACRQCQCCLWPILIPVDIITCPFRGIYHLIKKRSNKK
jgi:hypothetical protein